MARLRKTEPEAAVQATQELFWEHGFAGLGTRQIEEKTGLTRFMLQTAHGGKKTLFLQTVDAYLDMAEAAFLPDANFSSFEELANWFETRTNPESMPHVARYGCFMVNSIVEFHGQDQELNQRTDRFLTMMRERFSTILEAVKRTNASSVNLNVNDKVEILIGLTMSMGVVVCAAGNITAAEPLAMTVASMIREWENI